MKRSIWLSVGSVLLVAGVAFSHVARADFELASPDGRQILLKDDGTWRYVESTDKSPAEAKTTVKGEAVLVLERRMEHGNGCRFVVRLVNDLPYEIQSLVPYYSAYRANGVIYDTVSSPSSFTRLKSGDQQVREFEVRGITCKEIVRLQVVGGDQCVMGDLDKFSGGKGRCLARVRVVESDLVRFDK